MKNEDVPPTKRGGCLYDVSDVWPPRFLRNPWPKNHASHAESSHTRSAPRKHDRDKKREKMSPIFFKWVACRRIHLGMLIHFWGYDMSIIIRSCTPSFLGMIPQKLLTNLEESPWNLSENLWRETCSSASLCAKQLRSCKHRDSTYKTGSKVQYKGDPKHLEVISFLSTKCQTTSTACKNFKKMIVLRPFLIGLTLEWLKQLQEWHFNSARVRTKHG